MPDGLCGPMTTPVDGVMRLTVQQLLDECVAERDAARAETAMLREALEGCASVHEAWMARKRAKAALAASPSDWLAKHDADLLFVPNANLENCKARLELLREANEALKVERDALAAMALAWQPIETFPAKSRRYEGEMILLLPPTGAPQLLRALPSEWHYDFADAEETYYERRLFTHWMPMPCDPGSANESRFTTILATRDAAKDAEINALKAQLATARRDALREVLYAIDSSTDRRATLIELHRMALEEAPDA